MIEDDVSEEFYAEMRKICKIVKINLKDVVRNESPQRCYPIRLKLQTPSDKSEITECRLLKIPQ